MIAMAGIEPGKSRANEDDLDLDENKTTFYGGIAWRFSSRHSLDLEYFVLCLDGSRSADKRWDIGVYRVLG